MNYTNQQKEHIRHIHYKLVIHDILWDSVRYMHENHYKMKIEDLWNGVEDFQYLCKGFNKVDLCVMNKRCVRANKQLEILHRMGVVMLREKLNDEFHNHIVSCLLKQVI
jgi:hypothetical protein